MLVLGKHLPALCVEYPPDLGTSCHRTGFSLHLCGPRRPPLLSICSDPFPMILQAIVLLLLQWALRWQLLRNNNTGCYHNQPATLRLPPLLVILGWTWLLYSSLFVHTHQLPRSPCCGNTFSHRATKRQLSTLPLNRLPRTPTASGHGGHKHIVCAQLHIGVYREAY